MVRPTNNLFVFRGALAWVSVALLLASLLPVSEASAQTLRGRLLELGTDQPIPRGLVALVNPNGLRVAAVLTDDAGEFLLQAPAPGGFYVYGEGLGYRPETDGPLELEAGSDHTVAFHLARDPFVLDSLAVVGTPRNRWLEFSGFYERRELGRGHFLEKDFIQERNPRRPTDLFRQIPGFRVMPVGDGTGANIILSRRFSTMKPGSKAGQCGPTVYLDGLRVGKADNPATGSLDHILETNDILGIEAYVGVSQIPEQWRDSEAACGVIAIWTGGE